MLRGHLSSPLWHARCQRTTNWSQSAGREKRALEPKPSVGDALRARLARSFVHYLLG